MGKRPAQKKQYLLQVNKENDSKISHQPLNILTRFEFDWIKFHIYRDILRLSSSSLATNKWGSKVKKCAAVLCVGGDNYSLDYGIPKTYVALDNYVNSKNKPIILWGASVGPFSKMPDYEEFMVKHLKKITGIFARESATIAYLSGKGIKENVYKWKICFLHELDGGSL